MNSASGLSESSRSVTEFLRYLLPMYGIPLTFSGAKIERKPKCPNGTNLFYFLSSLPLLPPPSHHGSVWLLPVFSLLLTNTVLYSEYGLAYPCGRKGFVGTTKKTSVGLLVLIPRCFHTSMFSFPFYQSNLYFIFSFSSYPTFHCCCFFFFHCSLILESL
jgi:hypothetical protein